MGLQQLEGDRKADLLATPFVTSFLAQARPGPRGGPDTSAQWASWFLRSLALADTGRRKYVAMLLDGRIYRAGELTERAHIELPERIWQTPERLFPTRLASAGAALRFPSFIYDEVTALRRSMLALPTSPTIVDTLAREAPRLRQALENMTGRIAPALGHLQLTSDPAPITRQIGPPVSGPELARILPAAARWQAHIEPKLAERSGDNLSRRLHIWTLATADGTVPVITPRLTVGSLLRDPQLAPEKETPAAALMRLVILTRLAHHLGLDAEGIMPPPPPAEGHLRTIAARAEGKTPEAGAEAAVTFCARHDDPADAYQQLLDLANGRLIMTVTEPQFAAAHRRIVRSAEKAEDPQRSDIDTVLPLLVTAEGDIVRVTFVRKKDAEQAPDRQLP